MVLIPTNHTARKGPAVIDDDWKVPKTELKRGAVGVSRNS